MLAARLAAIHRGYPQMRPAFRRRLEAGLAAKPSSEPISRRTALVSGLAVAVGAASGAVIERLPASMRRPMAQTIIPASGKWTDVAAVDELPQGQAVAMRAGGITAYVFRLGTGVTAVSAICSHLPCRLEWRPEHRDLYCACHAQSFAASGQPMGNRTLPPLTRIAVQVVRDRVQVLGT